MDPGRLASGLVREVRGVIRAESATHRHLRDRLVIAGTVTVVVDVIATMLIFLLERHAAGSDVRSIGSAAFWTTSQILTVSSQFGNPISPAARVLDVLLEIYAITVVATLAGMFGAFFHRRGLERDPLHAQQVHPPPASGPG